jgi:hypothetical protein
MIPTQSSGKLKFLSLRQIYGSALLFQLLLAQPVVSPVVTPSPVQPSAQPAADHKTDESQVSLLLFPMSPLFFNNMDKYLVSWASVASYS